MKKPSPPAPPKLRSRQWFDNPAAPDMTALYLERQLNFGLTREELQGGMPIVGIAQTGGDLSPCNRIHLELAKRVKDGVRAAGGVPLEFAVHPIQETLRRPTAALDRNLAFLGLLEILHGYPLDAVVLATGCDKTTPACVMAAVAADLPAIVLSGGPMLDGWQNGRRVGSGAVIWEGRALRAAGKINAEQFMEMAAASAPSAGHCNTMGTALTMNSLAEAMGMSLPGCAAIPAPLRERAQVAFRTGRRIVEMVREDLRPSRVLSQESIENAIVVNSAIGGSTNAPIHVSAIARHAGLRADINDWQKIGLEIPLLVNCQPAGEFLGESFHRAGGVPAVCAELLSAKKLRGDAMTVTGRTLAENISVWRRSNPDTDRRVIFSFRRPLKKRAGFLVLRGNLFDSAVMKTSGIGEDFTRRHLRRPGRRNILEGRAVVFEGSEDYRARVNDPSLKIGEDAILVMRGAGVLGWPGSAEVVNMAPPDRLVRRGIESLPCVGDGRQSGTSASPSILNASPESAAGGGLALLRTGDRIRIDLNRGTADALVDDAEWSRRRSEWVAPKLASDTPWQVLYRRETGQLESGACLEFALEKRGVARKVPRHNH